MIFNRNRKFGAACFLLVFLCIGSFAQSPRKGFVPGGGFAVSDFETVNMQNGNVMLSFPLAQLPAGRNGLTAGVYLTYNSKLYDARDDYFRNEEKPCALDSWVDDQNGGELGLEGFYLRCGYYSKSLVRTNPQGGWRVTAGYTIELEDRTLEYATLPAEMQPTCAPGQPGVGIMTYRYKVNLIFPDGSRHEMIPYGHTDWNGDRYFNVQPDGTLIQACGTSVTTVARPSYYSVDGTYIRMEYLGSRWVLYFPDGSRYDFGNESAYPRLYDRNSNYVEFQSGQIVDEFGRSIRFGHDLTTGEETYTMDGPGGEDVVTRVKWKQIYVTKKYKPYVQGVLNNCAASRSCPPNTDPESIDASHNVVDYIKLPSQVGGDLRYRFQYNGYDVVPNPITESVGLGELREVILPSTAHINYTYTLDGQPGIGIFTKDALDNRIIAKSLSYQNEHDGVTEPITENSFYDIVVGSGGTITNPDGSTSSEAIWPAGWRAGRSVATVGTDGTKVEKYWEQSCLTTCNNSISFGVNPNLKADFTFVNEGGSYHKVAIKEYSYDKNGNITETKEYDWIPLTSITIPRDGPNGPINGMPSGISSYLKRITRSTTFNETPNSTSPSFGDPDVYIYTSSPRLLRLPQSAEVLDSSETPKSRSEMEYDFTNYLGGNTIGGNLTVTRTWDSTKGEHSKPLTAGNSISTSATYNSYGMPLTTTDARGIQTTISYGCIDGSPTCSNTMQNLYPTRIEAASNYASVKRTSATTYDFNTGLTTTSTDVDNGATTTSSYDALGRPTSVTAPNGAKTQTVYSDTARYVITRSDVHVANDAKNVSTIFYDQLGRVRLAKSLEDAETQSPYNETDGIKVQTRYRIVPGSSGLTCQLTSNPYRADISTNENQATMGWTLSATTSSGLQSSVTTFSGTSLPTECTYGGGNSTGTVTTSTSGNATTVTDQAGKPRRAIFDALARLVRVDEPNLINQLGSVNSPSQATVYDYDVLNNLTSVTQGIQSRSFSYSSLSRQLSSQNPEAGLVSSTYDDNGNLRTQRDGRGVKTIYDYDALDRVIRKCFRLIGTGPIGAISCPDASGEPFEPNTSDATYTYDDPTVSNSRGRLTRSSNGISTTQIGGFDAVGNVLSDAQTIAGQTYTNSYTYRIDGQLYDETYPSGRVVRNLTDNAGELSQVLSRKGQDYNFVTYASQFAYSPNRRVTSLRLGNNTWESVQYNSRLQPVQISVGTALNGDDLWKINYEFGEVQTSGTVDTTKNNSNIGRQIITVPTIGSAIGFTAFQTFTYDNLNRLIIARETNSGGSQIWKQTSNYDQYGNRTLDAGNTTTIPIGCPAALCNPSISAGDNRFASGQGYLYDESGNVTQNADNARFIYDASNKIVEVRNATTTALITKNYYDSDGVRVKVEENGVTTLFVNDIFDRVVAEYTINAPSNPNPNVSYLTPDLLGTPRLITGQNRQVLSRRDMTPFGEEISAGVGGRTGAQQYTPIGFGLRQKFTGKERDEAAKLDYFNARHYTFSLGRFMSADNFGGKLSNPQSLNFYSYTLNNPLKWVDPSGHAPDDPERECTSCKLDKTNYLYMDGGLYSIGNAVVNVSGGESSTGPSSVTQREGPPDLPASGWDLVPGYGTTRRLAYNMSCGANGGCNITRATGNFVWLAFELSPIGQIGWELSLARNAFAREVLGGTESIGHGLIRNLADDVVEETVHLNNNMARSNFGVYEITVDDVVHKFGKAHLDRITKSSGLPTRVHQQVRKLRKENPDSIVRSRVIQKLPDSTTRQAKGAENATIQIYYDKTGIVPKGNAPSFRPQ